MRGIQLTGGYAVESGGGVHVGAGASLHLEDAIVQSCVVNASGIALGGGISNFGNLTARSLRVRDNLVLSGTGIAGGGGLLNAGEGDLTLSAIEGNRCRSTTSAAQGGGVLNWGRLVARETIFGRNALLVSESGSQSMGGAVHSHDGTSVELYSCTLHENVVTTSTVPVFGAAAALFGASLRAHNTSFLTNRAASQSGRILGGALFVSSASEANLSSCVLSGNLASNHGLNHVVGGVAYVQGIVRAHETTFSNNAATSVNGSVVGGAAHQNRLAERMPAPPAEGSSRAALLPSKSGLIASTPPQTERARRAAGGGRRTHRLARTKRRKSETVPRVEKR